MPLALPDLQVAFAAHIAGDDRAGLIASVVGDSISAAARLRVYRHHVFHSLVSALAATFPTVQALVGEAFFRDMARSFVDRTLPIQPVLSEYGEGLADFIGGHAPAAGLPYLSDVARLDWAMNVAYRSPLEPRLAVVDLAVVPTELLPTKSVSLAPGTAIIRSVFPLDRIWAAAQPGASDDTVDAGSSDARLLVLRRPDDAGFVTLSLGEASFVEALAVGRTLEEATGAALAADPGFDLSPTFRRLLSLEAFAAVQ